MVRSRHHHITHHASRSLIAGPVVLPSPRHLFLPSRLAAITFRIFRWRTPSQLLPPHSIVGLLILPVPGRSCSLLASRFSLISHLNPNAAVIEASCPCLVLVLSLPWTIQTKHSSLRILEFAVCTCQGHGCWQMGHIPLSYIKDLSNHNSAFHLIPDKRDRHDRQPQIDPDSQ